MIPLLFGGWLVLAFFGMCWISYAIHILVDPNVGILVVGLVIWILGILYRRTVGILGLDRWALGISSNFNIIPIHHCIFGELCIDTACDVSVLISFYHLRHSFVGPFC